MPFAGGSAVAKKLICLYFALFKLILQGKVGQAHELQAKKEEQQDKKRGKGVEKRKTRWKSRPGAAVNGKTDRKPSQDLKTGLLPESQVRVVVGGGGSGSGIPQKMHDLSALCFVLTVAGVSKAKCFLNSA